MKILSTNYLYLPQKVNRQNVYSYNSTDNFVKSPGFKQAPQNMYKEILNNPTKVQELMKLFLQFAATFLVAAEAGEQLSGKQEESAPDSNIFTNFLASLVPNQKNNEQEISQYKTKIEELENEKEALRLQLEEQQWLGGVQDKSITSRKETEEKPVVKQAVIFPKKNKIGRLSKELKQLKFVIEQLALPQEECKNLTIICQELLNDSAKIVNDKEVNKNYTAEILAKKLSKKDADYKQIIDEYLRLLGFIQDTQEVTEPPKAMDNKAFLEAAGLKIVGKIDSDKIDYKRPRQRITIPKSKADSIEHQSSQEEIQVIDEPSGTMKFKIPGTINKDISLNLKRLIVRFEKQLTENYEKETEKGNEAQKPRWAHRAPLPVEMEEVEKEIIEEISSYNQFKQNDNKISTYKNINEDNIHQIAEILSSNPKFHKLCSRHSALRLIDRYVDFESDIPIEEQSNRIIDKLEQVIQNSFKKGVEVQTYEDRKYKGFYAPRITIPPECMDDEAKDIFGTFPLKITFCENQPDRTFYSKYNKQGLICTVFSQGI